MASPHIIESVPFYKDEKLAIFIDGSNLHATAKALDFDMDYRKLLQWAAQQGRLVRSFYYTTLLDDQDFKPLKPLMDWLDYNGYQIVTKPLRESTDDQGRRRVKSSMDLEIAIDMIEIADHTDHIMLFSGEGDYARLVEAVQRKGVRVTVVSTLQGGRMSIADDLRRQADHFLDLDDVADYVMRGGFEAHAAEEAA